MSLILTDIDHVILNHADAFQNWLIDYKSNRYKDRNWRNYPNIEDFMETTTDKVNEVILEFNRSKYFKDLKPEYKSEEYIPMLKNEGYSFIGITACGTDEKVKENRYINMEKYFPGIFDEIFYVDDPKDKLYYLSKYEESIWVEDSEDNALLGDGCGHRTYLMDQPYNICFSSKNIKRVYSWEDIYYDLPN